MAEITTIMENNAIPLKRKIHDCVDTGDDLALSSGVEINLPVDCAVRDYKSTDLALWNNTTAIVKDSIDDNEIKVKLKLELNGAANDICQLRVFVPHPTFGDIEVDYQELVLYKNNTDTLFTTFTLLYNGTDSEATTYGFKITLTPTGNMTLKQRSILVTA
jgi:hypothetical protein